MVNWNILQKWEFWKVIIIIPFYVHYLISLFTTILNIVLNKDFSNITYLFMLIGGLPLINAGAIKLTYDLLKVYGYEFPSVDMNGEENG